MKQKLKKIPQLLIFCIVIVVSSCQKDYETTKSDEQKSVFGKVNLNQIPKIKKAIDEKRNNNSSRQNASIYLNLINPENIKTFTDNLGHVSYTFALNLEEENRLSNLLVTETNNGLKYYLIQYTSNNFEQWIQDVNNDIKSNIDAEMSFEDLDAPSLTTSKCYMIELTTVCQSGDHSSSDGNLGDCTLDPLTQWNDIYALVNTHCGAGNGDGVTIPNGGGSTTTLTDPCNNLKRKIDPTKANLKQAIIDLKALLNSTGENGVSLSKNANGTYPPPLVILPSSNDKIKVPIGGDVYGSIHTHPTSSSPMFSFSDVYSLFQFLDQGNFQNESEITIMLVVLDRGVIETYALTIDNQIEFYQAITNVLNDAEGSTTEEKLFKIDAALEMKYMKNREVDKTFLQEFGDFGISLFKANSTITSWSKLTLSNPDIIPQTVKPIPCN